MAVFHTYLVNLKIEHRNLRHNECFAVIIAIGFTHSILDLLTPIMKSGRAHSIYGLVFYRITENTKSATM